MSSMRHMAVSLPRIDLRGYYHSESGRYYHQPLDIAGSKRSSVAARIPRRIPKLQKSKKGFRRLT